MKSRAALVRYYEWQVDDRRKVLAELFAMAERLDREEKRLDVTTAVEQVKAEADDIGQYSYPGFARGVIERRSNIQATRVDLESKIDEAKEALQLAYQDLKKIEILEERRIAKEALEEKRLEQAELDELGQRRHGEAEGF